MAKTKNEFVEQIREEQAQWQLFLDDVQSRIKDSSVDISFATGEWTLKDLIAHLTAWWRIDFAEIQAGCGQPSGYLMPWPVECHWNPHKDQDQINDWIYK